MENHQRLALVTGASSGIGEALCYLLAEKGINLIMTARSESNLNRIAQDLRSKVNVTVFPADLSLPHDRSLLIKKIQELSPDLVINNAGFGLYGDAISHTPAEEGEIVNLNVNALLEITLETARHMVSQQQKGVILNVSSVAAFIPMPGSAVYAASKSFVNSFSEGLDVELKDKGVRVLASCPGQVATKFRQRASQGQSDSQPQEPLVMSSSFAAQQIWMQIETLKTVHIFDWKYRLLLLLLKFLPRSYVSKMLYVKIQERNKNR